MGQWLSQQVKQLVEVMRLSEAAFGCLQVGRIWE